MNHFCSLSGMMDFIILNRFDNEWYGRFSYELNVVQLIISVCVCVCVCVYIYIYIYIYMCVCVCVYVCVCLPVHGKYWHMESQIMNITSGWFIMIWIQGSDLSCWNEHCLTSPCLNIYVLSIYLEITCWKCFKILNCYTVKHTHTHTHTRTHTHTHTHTHTESINVSSVIQYIFVI